jgi:hypothetical protein
VISFTVNRDNVNLDADLLVQARLGGTATLNYDYTGTGYETANGNVLSIRIPPNQNSKRVVLKPVAGLVQPDLTVSLTILPDPLHLTIDGVNPTAIGTLTFLPI